MQLVEYNDCMYSTVQYSSVLWCMWVGVCTVVRKGLFGDLCGKGRESDKEGRGRREGGEGGGGRVGG